MENGGSQFQFYLNFRARQLEAGHVRNSPLTGETAVHVEIFGGHSDTRHL